MHYRSVTANNIYAGITAKLQGETEHRILKDQYAQCYAFSEKRRNNTMKNPSIKCDVVSCKHNMDSEHYCTLDCICVGTHEANPTVPECTDCLSFEKKSGCGCR